MRLMSEQGGNRRIDRIWGPAGSLTMIIVVSLRAEGAAAGLSVVIAARGHGADRGSLYAVRRASVGDFVTHIPTSGRIFCERWPASPPARTKTT